jgi:hypothetical protein
MALLHTCEYLQGEMECGSEGEAEGREARGSA